MSTEIGGMQQYAIYEVVSWALYASPVKHPFKIC